MNLTVIKKTEKKSFSSTKYLRRSKPISIILIYKYSIVSLKHFMHYMRTLETSIDIFIQFNFLRIRCN